MKNEHINQRHQEYLSEFIPRNRHPDPEKLFASRRTKVRQEKLTSARKLSMMENSNPPSTFIGKINEIKIQKDGKTAVYRLSNLVYTFYIGKLPNDKEVNKDFLNHSLITMFL